MVEALFVAVVVIAVLLVGTWVVLYQMVKQRGRLLLRLDEIEHQLRHGGQHIIDIGRNGANAEPAGLPPGAAMPTFRLPDLDGQMVALEDLRGEQVLLVNWSPQCGFCEMIAPDLAKLQPNLRKRNVQLVLAAYGDAEANRALARDHGLECPILLQSGDSAVEALASLGTPAAYLLDEQGLVVQPLAVGADQVPKLARQAAGAKGERRRLPGERSLADSRIEREGLKAGTPAPLFTLPDLYGRTVSLEEYRGRRVLLVFTDPHCGPCEELAPHLAQLHRERRDENLAIVMVGRGDPGENRRKAEQFSFEFPVVLQKRWELSRQYGIFATPVAFLIDERGMVMRSVAEGVGEILGLMPGGPEAGREVRNGRRF